MRDILAGVFLFTPLLCFGVPLVTITCESPKGLTQDYGVTGAQRMQAAGDHKPQPAAHFSGPYEDGFTGRPTFIVDSDRKMLTLL